MRVTIFGAGCIGGGIGTRVLAGGNDVEVIDTDPEDAHALARELGAHGERSAATVESGGRTNGEVVILAVYRSAVAEVVRLYGEQLVGKDSCRYRQSPRLDTMDGVVTPPDNSSAEATATLVPEGTPVVKAFNTTFGNTLVPGGVAGQRLEVLIAGDDEETKNRVAELVSGRAGSGRSTPLRRAGRASSSSSALVHQPSGSPFAAPRSSYGERPDGPPRS